LDDFVIFLQGKMNAAGVEAMKAVESSDDSDYDSDESVDDDEKNRRATKLKKKVLFFISFFVNARNEC
jgi:hypothetical protein